MCAGPLRTVPEKGKKYAKFLANIDKTTTFLTQAISGAAVSEAEAGVQFRIVETGGLSMKSVLQRSNPLETPGCDDEECLPCKPGRGEGGQCDGCGINYKIECQLCPDGQKEAYIGESSRNLYTRSLEYVNNFRR